MADSKQSLARRLLDKQRHKAALSRGELAPPPAAETGTVAEIAPPPPELAQEEAPAGKKSRTPKPANSDTVSELAPPAGKKSPAPKTAKKTATAVTFACGHTQPAERIARAICQTCRDAAAHEANEKRREAQELQQQKARLPDGSRFNVVYDAEAVLWRGSLTIPGEQGAAVFEAEDGAVFKLLRDLDSQYRAALTAGAAGTNQEAVR